MRIKATLYLLLSILILDSFPLYGQNSAFSIAHFSTENGLIDNQVNAVLKDDIGFIWIGTNGGLVKYDGQHFKNFVSDDTDTTTIRANLVKVIKKDKNGLLWLGTIGGGLNCFNPINQQSIHFPYIIQNPKIEGQDVTSILIENTGNIWIGTYNCGLQYFNQATKSFTRYNLVKEIENNQDGFKRNTVFDILEDKDDANLLWIATNNGLFSFHKEEKIFQQHPLNIEGQKDTSTTILDLYMEKSNILWVGTWRLGMGKLEIPSNKWSFFIPDRLEFQNNNHYTNIVNKIERKSDNELWVSSQDMGLIIFDESKQTFQKIKSSINLEYSAKSNKTNGLYKDATNRLWIFNYHNGLSLWNPVNDSFKFYPLLAATNCTNEGNEVNDFSYDTTRKQFWLTTQACPTLINLDTSYNVIQTTSLDQYFSEQNTIKVLSSSQGNIWLAGTPTMSSKASLYTFLPQQQQLIPFTHPHLDTIPLHNYQISDLHEDKLGNLWIATNFGGLIKYNSKNQSLKQYIYLEDETKGKTTHIQISNLEIAKNGVIWLATLEEGVLSFDPEKERFKQYATSTEKEKGLMGKRILTLQEDKNGKIWVGLSLFGIQVIDPSKKDWLIQTFQNKNNDIDNNVDKIICSADSSIWVTTSKGLFKYQSSTKKFSQIKYVDANFSNRLNGKGILGTDSELLIGQAKGIYTYPLKKSAIFNKIIFNSFKVFDKELDLLKDLHYTKKINLSYNQNFFTVGFATLAFTLSKSQQYATKLEGYDKDWIFQNQENTTSTYKNVSPGSYTFKVKQLNNETNQQTDEIQLSIIITPPLWKTWWAYSAYFLMSLGLIILVYNFQLNRKIALEEARQLKALDEAKTKLFDNITHEFRTPLTIILGYIDRSLRQNRVLKNSELILMKDNSEQLLKLINQILKLSELDAKAVHLNNEWNNLFQFIRYIVQSFQTIAEEKQLHLSVKANQQQIIAYFDKEKLSIILSNLITNAIKFTKQSGQIEVITHLRNQEPEMPSLNPPSPFSKWQLLEIYIKDSGIGIAKDKIPFVFDRFYQINPNPTVFSKSTTSSGIGLALTKELVELMQGKIDLDSKEGFGSTFKVKIPILVKEEVNNKKTIVEDTDKAIVLYVEDNESLIEYISEEFKKHYQLLICRNGREGLATAIEVIPDVIISDILMPQMDGFSLCQAIKKDDRTSHIPIILLTAKIAQVDRRKGLQSGADAYLTKPFDEKELHLRIQNLINQQKKLRQYYLAQQRLETDSMPSNVKNVPTNPTNKLFLEKVILFIDERLEDAEFTVKELVTKMGLSNTQFHRKIVAITGKPPVKLIQLARIRKAKQLLKETDFTIAEIAYKTGFSDPAYFSKTFKSILNLSPSQFKKRLKT